MFAPPNIEALARMNMKCEFGGVRRRVDVLRGILEKFGNLKGGFTGAARIPEALLNIFLTRATIALAQILD